MKKSKTQLYVGSILLIALMLMGQSGIIQALPSITHSTQILNDTLIGSNSNFVEGLELIAGEGSALITQYYQFGGEKMFPLNPSGDAFQNLNYMYIISSNQRNWHDYWPRSIWEFRDGATVVLSFSEGIEESLADAEDIIPALSTWMGTNLNVLYGAEILGQTTLFYWGYMSAQNHSDFIIDEFYDVFTSGGYTNFITNDVIASAPVSVVGTGLIKQEASWVPLAVSAFIQEDGISINVDDTHNMSITEAFDFSGPIRPAPNSVWSSIEFKLPYVANVYDSYPETDSLYPELTGNFKWTMKIGEFYERVPEDIYVTYDMAIEELVSFPQITANVDANITALHSETDPKLNYTITITNTGDETAYNTTFAWDLGNEEPKPEYIYVFDSDNYLFDANLTKYYNYSSGLIVDTFALTEHADWDNLNLSLEITGWFVNKSTGLVVQPVTDYYYNSTTGRSMYHINIEETMKLVYTNKSAFNFLHSDNLNTTYDNGTFYIYGIIDELANGTSIDYWWAITDLPSKDDIFVVLGYNGSSDWVNGTGSGLGWYYQTNLTIIDNTSKITGGITNVKDWIVKETLDSGADLRWPALGEFAPSIMFRYEDSVSREYFGWSNGLIIQLYDDEAILKTTVTLNSTIYEVDQVAEINVTIENIGDAVATNVQIQGFHAFMGPDWQLRDLYEFSGEVPIGTINPGESITYTFLHNVSTFLGIHPVGIVVDYTTEESEGYGNGFNRTDITDIASNLILAVVLPKSDKAGQDEPSYPTPEVNVSVSWSNTNGNENITNGDILEIRTEITNVGDEDTTIKVFSYFPTAMAGIDMSGAYNGQNFKITDISGNTLTDYDEGFAVDHWQWPISIAAVAGLHLAPGATIVFYYRINVTDINSLILPPVAVEYDSRYPMTGTSGIEGGSDGGEGTPFESSSFTGISINGDTHSLRLSLQESGSGNTWTSYSDASLLASFAAVSTGDTTTTTSPPGSNTTSGVPGFTTLTSFVRDNMKLMIVVLALPVIVLVIKERRRIK